MQTQNKQSLEKSIRENPKEKFQWSRLISNEKHETIPGYYGKFSEWLPVIGIISTAYREGTHQRCVMDSNLAPLNIIYQSLCTVTAIGGIINYLH